MLVGEARRQARAWVEDEAAEVSGFLGAFLTGSTKWKPADAPHRASSDVDVRVVVRGPETPPDRKKALYRDVLLEAGFASREEMGSTDEILANPFLAGSLWKPVLLADPTGQLADLARPVSAEFPRRARVEERGHGARDLALLWFDRIEQAPSFPEQVTCWLFGTSVTTYVLLAAGLRNLTVRRRYVDSRALLEEHARVDVHEQMLDWLGCAHLDAARTRHHLDALAAAFDATLPHVDPSFRFAADLRPDARAIAVDGSRELIDDGLHREAVYWLGATYCRCLQGLRENAPDTVRALCDAGLRDLLRDLGVVTRADLASKADHVRTHIPELEAVAASIRDATPEITD